MPRASIADRFRAAARAFGAAPPQPAVASDDGVRDAATQASAPDHPVATERTAALAVTSAGSPFARSPFLLGFLATLGGLAAFALGQAIVGLSSVLVLILVSLFLATGLNPAVEWLVGKGMRRGVAILLMFLAVIGIFAVIVLAIVPPVVEQGSSLLRSAPDLINRLGENATIRDLDERFDILSKLQDLVSGDALGTAFGGILGFGKAVLGAVFSALTVLVLTLYFLSSFRTIKETGYRLVPASRRDRVRNLGDRIIANIGGYVAGQITVATLAGLVAYVFMMTLGHIIEAPIVGQYALALAIIVGIFDLVPLIGALVGSAIVTLVGLVDSWTVGLILLGYFIVYQQLENYLLSPRIMKRSVNIAPMLTIVGALIGGTLLGMVGALVAVPTTAAVVMIVREVVIPRQDAA